MFAYVNKIQERKKYWKTHCKIILKESEERQVNVLVKYISGATFFVLIVKRKSENKKSIAGEKKLQYKIKQSICLTLEKSFQQIVGITCETRSSKLFLVHCGQGLESVEIRLRCGAKALRRTYF